MSIDTERISRFLLEIKSRSREIAALLAVNTDAEILQELWRLNLTSPIFLADADISGC